MHSKVPWILAGALGAVGLAATAAFSTVAAPVHQAATTTSVASPIATPGVQPVATPAALVPDAVVLDATKPVVEPVSIVHVVVKPAFVKHFVAPPVVAKPVAAAPAVPADPAVKDGTCDKNTSAGLNPEALGCCWGLPVALTRGCRPSGSPCRAAWRCARPGSCGAGTGLRRPRRWTRIRSHSRIRARSSSNRKGLDM